MSCNIHRNKHNKISKVVADNGNTSILYNTLESLPFLTSEQAVNRYVFAKNSVKKDTVLDSNGEPKLVFQPIGGESNLLDNGGILSYSTFDEALELDRSGKGVRFGILSSKNLEEFSPTEKLQHKRKVETLIKIEDSKNPLKVTDKGSTYYVNKKAKDFTLVDKFDRNVNMDTKDGFIARLVNVGIKMKTKQKTGIPLAVERNNGNPLNLAPNGEPSILFQSYKDLGYSNEKAEELVAKTFSDEFLTWFGDWLNSPENASKVVDENGQPLVVFHGTPYNVNSNGEIKFYPKTSPFYEFKKGIGVGGNQTKFYFTDNKKVASLYAGNYGHIHPVFLNVNKLDEEVGLQKGFNWLAENEKEFLDNIENFKGDIDGLVITDIYDSPSGKYKREDLLSNVYVVNNPNQIKSATENTGDFSLENNDIRFQIIGEQGAKALDSKEEATYRMDNLNVARQMKEAGKTPKEIKLATGWEKHNKLWKYEIPDGKLNKSAIVTKVEKKEYLGEITGEVSLNELYENEELYTAYPHLKSKKVKIIDITSKGVEQLYGFVKEGELYLNKKEYGKINAKQISHEIQHLLQNIEGFGTGSSPNRYIGEVTYAVNKFKSEEQESFGGNRGGTFVGNNTIEEQIKKYLVSIGAVEKEVPSLIRSLTSETIADLAYGMYLRTSGEVEANNVETRFDMTLKERRNSLLLETEDVAQEDQILLRNVLGEQASIKNNKETLQQVLEQLKKTGLADNVYLLSNKEIEDKLKELGYSEDITKQIIGEKGARNLDNREEATTRLDNLGVAKEMEIAGKTAKEIKLSTGWEKHNKLWKYEIPDGKVIDKELEINKEYPIQEVLTNTESTEGLKIIILDEKEFDSREEEARYNPATRRIEINRRTVSRAFNTSPVKEMGYYLPSKLQRTLSHEVQHDHQQINGFDGGGGFRSVANRAAEIVGISGVISNQDLSTEIDSKLKGTKLNIEDRKVLEATKDILTAKTGAIQKIKLINYYRKIAGEVEARNVEKRMNMSPEERINSLLLETEDVAQEDQLFIKNNLSTSSKIKTTTNGFVVTENGQDNIYLNTEANNPTETSLHEYSHIYLKKLKESNPEIYKRGEELVKTEDAKEIVEFVKTNQPNLLEGTDAFTQEVLAEITGRRASKILAGKESEVKTWLVDFLDWLRSKLSIREISNEDLANLTLEGYAELVGEDLLRGEELFSENNKYIPKEMKTINISNIIEQLISTGEITRSCKV